MDCGPCAMLLLLMMIIMMLSLVYIARTHCAQVVDRDLAISRGHRFWHRLYWEV